MNDMNDMGYDMNDMGYGSYGILWYFMMFGYFDFKTTPYEAKMFH